MRLARYNVETADDHGDEGHLHFSGLPSPDCKPHATIAGFAIMFNTLRSEENVVALCGGDRLDAPVDFAVYRSRCRVDDGLADSLSARDEPDFPWTNTSFGHVVAIVFTGVAIAAFRGYSVPLICLAFSFSSGPVLLARGMARNHSYPSKERRPSAGRTIQ